MNILQRGAQPATRQRHTRSLKGVLTTLLMAPLMALAAPSITWNHADGSQFPVGTSVQIEGQATSNITGSGLDLALVLDASGSMCCALSGPADNRKTRQQWQQDAAIALINSLPVGNTSVTIVQYASGATVRLELTPMTSADDIIAAINAIPASGGTRADLGIQSAQGELLGPNATDGRTKQMVVISDGASSGNPQNAAEAAAAAGITVHAVAIPGGSVSQMQNIATNGGGTFANFTDPSDLADIENFFSTGGGFAGLERLDLTLPDGTVLEDYATDAFGNFSLDPAWLLQAGANEFTATAWFNDGSTTSSTLTLYGQQDSTAVPTPGTAALMLLALGLYGGLRRQA